MKILRVIDRLNVGGPAIHAALATRELNDDGYETVLVTGEIEPGEADMSYLLDEYGVERVLIPSLGRELRPLRDLATAYKLWRVMRRVRPDVVHTHKAKAGAIGRVVALLAGVPVRVHTYHGHVFHGYFSPAKTRIFLAIERALARITTRLVAPAPALVDELTGRYRIAAADRFRVVPLGFDLAPFTRAADHRGHLRKQLGLGDGVRLVAIVGRMVPVKDHATFIAAAALLAARHDDLQFVFVGGGELEGEVRAQLETRGLTARAHLLGWTRHLDRIYADLDVVALSSVNEGTPVALIEAMAAGVPVAATRVGGVANVLHDGARGELAPPRDPAALAAAIERALAPEARARAARIRAEVTAEFGADRLRRDLAALYDDLSRAPSA
ncbi:MAG: glycosyltransferase [Myxococcales bacterium]|nr:glycosyltransferase [Myxococcales bacterium]